MSQPEPLQSPEKKIIRIGIVGYGNLGRGVELAIGNQPDMSLGGIFTRRDPAALESATNAPAHRYEELLDPDGPGNELDVLILCGGSRSDLPEQTPELAARYNVVDSFDTHARIPEHFDAVSARVGSTTAIISTGWDPGLFSINRVYAEAVLPRGETSTFWGKGLSQGHSDAVRRVPGVAAGVQYTVPSSEAMDAARAGDGGGAPASTKHTRHCFVVLEDGADPEQVRTAIVTMPDYFAEYRTTVEFITADELTRDHRAMPHGGFVIRSGVTSPGARQVVEFSLKLESNPEFTASILVAYARAAHRLQRSGQHGVFTPFDVAPGLLHPAPPEHLRATML